MSVFLNGKQEGQHLFCYYVAAVSYSVRKRQVRRETLCLLVCYLARRTSSSVSQAEAFGKTDA